MSFLLTSQDLKDQKISGLLIKNAINNEAPLSFKKSSKLLDNNEIKVFINRSKKKKGTVCPTNLSLNSSVQSTLNTINSISQKDNSKLNKFFKDLSLTNSITSSSKRSDLRKSMPIRRSAKPKTDDMKFLYKIFFNYEADSTIKMPSINFKKENKINNNENKYNLKYLRNYIIKIQTEFNEGGELLMMKTDKNNIPFLIDYYINKKLEDLIARYSLIIFLYIKMKNYIEAKRIFLLMIKENMKYFNYMENKIVNALNNKDKNNKVQDRDNYKMIQQLIKIYSFIIRYSQLFNTMNNRNKFMGKYFRLINLNFRYIFHLSDNLCLNNEIKHQLIYWFSFYISYANYYSILNYTPIIIPITLNKIILSLYKNVDEQLLNIVENRFLLDTKYNQGLVLYINNQKDEALFNLRQAEEKMKLLEVRQKLPKKDYIISQHKNTINSNLKILPYFDIKEKKKKLSYKSNIPITLWKKAKINEQNGFFSGRTIDLMKSMRTVKSGYSNYLYEDIENICKNFAKSTVNLSDINLLIEYGIDKGKLNSKDINTLNNNLFLLCQNSQKMMRNSQLINSRSRGQQDFHYPKYLIDPLFFKIELLMCEIEINKKNAKEAYERVLKCIFLLVLLKISKPNNYENDYNEIRGVITLYLKLIDDLCKEKLLESNSNDIDSFENSNGQLPFNLKLNQDFHNLNETKKNINEEIFIKEFEKFFIFLSSLSVYQITVLNETQPQNPKRNDLPISFSNQFKDCLSFLQRLQLDKLQTMTLSRFKILKNPNGWILHSNLNTNLLQYINKKNSLKSKMTLNYMTNIKRLKIYSLKKNKTEYNNYKKILLSKKTTPKIREFLNKNIHHAMKILKNSSEEEIKYIINNPLLLVRPIQKFKKKFGKKLRLEMNDTENMIFFDNTENGTSTMSTSNFDLRKTTKPSTERIVMKNRFSNTDFMINNSKFSIEKKENSNIKTMSSNTNRSKRRNKSTGNILIKQNIINNINHCSFINDPRGTKDYNDSFEDYKLSIDCSFNGI